VEALPLELVAFRVAVLYYPNGTAVAGVIRSEGHLCSALVATFPDLASHFVVLPRKPA
jgi:hypothetical protein